MRKIQRLAALGPWQAYQIVESRCKQAWFEYRLRERAQQRKAHSTWATLQKKYPRIDTLHYIFLTRSLRTTYRLLEQCYHTVPVTADQLVQGFFHLFGRTIHLTTTIDWHYDFLCEQHDNRFDYTQWYKDTIIEVGTSTTLAKDIRVPWELSRFSYAWVLGMAYQRTGNEQYAKRVLELILDWIDKNPYLLGINWVCPMEVAVRALNWIVALEAVKEYAVLHSDSWQAIVCSLYDHMQYLEHNWEWYDGRTSNHYLANVVGYYALVSFFKGVITTESHIQWCHRQLTQEMAKQVQADGTSYEGSTAYHRLVTELFMYAACLMRDNDAAVDDFYQQGLAKMVQFMRACIPHDGTLITVGDDDTSIIVSGLPEQEIKNLADTLAIVHTPLVPVHHYNHFGLSVIKTARWHITLRHHSYNKRQPSGHFHQDVASVTVALDGVSLLVDPGSYTYSGSAIWRNYFRSTYNHSSFGIAGHEGVMADTRLFDMDIPEQAVSFSDQKGHEVYTLYTYHDLYSSCGLRAHRKVVLDEKRNTLTLTDWWTLQSTQQVSEPLPLMWWRFIVPVGIEIQQASAYEAVLLHQGNSKVRMVTHIPLSQEQAWVAQGYAQKKSTAMLMGQLSLAVNIPYTTVFYSD